MRKKLIIVLLIFIVLLSTLILFGCSSDDNYEIVIKGIGIEDITITKKQIREIYEQYPVVYEGVNKAYASDKTDDDGNLIPHTLKGVYLDDVLAKYANGALSGAYSTVRLKASDGYETILTAETFSEEHGGTKMILALEYDGIKLSTKQESGAIRVVFPNQTANSWVKMLTEIIFENTVAEIPNVEKVTFLSSLNDSYNSSFVSNEQIGGTEKKVTNYGISLKKVFDNGILVGSKEEKMFINAWDYISNGKKGYYRPYENWKTYNYYVDSYLVMQTQIEDDEIKDEIRAPVFDGANILAGMSVKNVLSLSVGDSALICENVAFDRFDTDNDKIIQLKEVLELVKLYKEDSNYLVLCQDDSQINLSNEQMENAQFISENDTYNLKIEENSYLIKSISIVE